MCQFFSAIYTRQGNVYFTEEDSHETIISRLGMRDEDLFLRAWVRVEYVNDALKLDEGSCPSWFDRVEAEDKVKAVYEQVLSAWEAYKAATASAWEAYDAATAPAQEAYNAATASAWEACTKKLSTITGYVPPRS